MRVKTFSFVGSLDVGPVTLHIRPKIAPELVPTIMRYALSFKSIAQSAPVEMPVEKGGFVDVIAVLLVQEIDRMIHAGLFRDYRTKTEWLGAPKGRLVVHVLARKAPRHRLALPCTYHERTSDLALNQTVLAAARCLRPSVGDRALQFELHAREALLGEFCEDRPFTCELLHQARADLDRRSAYYEPLIDLAELILAAQGSSFGSLEKSAQLPGFLFDMNLLFERFVARLCREHAPPGLRVETQQGLRDSFRFRRNPHGWRLPQIRPDIVVYAGREPRLVLDAKYKDLGRGRPSATDLSQLTLYSMSFGRESFVPVRLVFPSTSFRAGLEPSIEFHGMGASGPLARVSVFGLDLERCAGALRLSDRREVSADVAAMLTPPN